MDPTDGVYWDNVNLQGEIDRAKFTYNSGQMIQAGVLLYKATDKKSYLREAQFTAKGSYNHFCKSRKTVMNDKQLFYPSAPWFNVILFRGLKALYEIDCNPTYIAAVINNADFAWQYSRTNDGPGAALDAGTALPASFLYFAARALFSAPQAANGPTLTSRWQRA